MWSKVPFSLPPKAQLDLGIIHNIFCSGTNRLLKCKESAYALKETRTKRVREKEVRLKDSSVLV